MCAGTVAGRVDAPDACLRTWSLQCTAIADLEEGFGLRAATDSQWHLSEMPVLRQVAGLNYVFECIGDHSRQSCPSDGMPILRTLCAILISPSAHCDEAAIAGHCFDSARGVSSE